MKSARIMKQKILEFNFINKEMKKNNLPDIAINDIPYIKEGIVNNLKDNPNPTIREACLSALNYIRRPEDKDVLRVLYEIINNKALPLDIQIQWAEFKITDLNKNLSNSINMSLNKTKNRKNTNQTFGI